MSDVSRFVGDLRGLRGVCSSEISVKPLHPIQLMSDV